MFVVFLSRVRGDGDSRVGTYCGGVESLANTVGLFPRLIDRRNRDVLSFPFSTSDSLVCPPSKKNSRNVANPDGS